MSLCVNSPVISEKFETYFNSIYGERWPSIRAALHTPVKHAIRLNRFSTESEKEAQGLKAIDGLEGCYWKPEGYQLRRDEDNRYTAYVLDPASVIVARALQVEKGDHILDLCAAPGGKSLIAAEEMFFAAGAGDLGSLLANEMSDARRERLLHVFQDYIPREQRDFVSVKGLDGNQYGLRQPSNFDRVLADVPCSGERHLFENHSELAMWTEKRTKNLAVRQYSLLSSAWLACRAGGRIVYSTCSISPLENDAVAGKLIKKREVTVLRPQFLESFEFLERTEYGYQVLPDRCGFGPMYFSVLQKSYC